MIKKEILQRLEYLKGLLEASNKELEERFHLKDIDVNENRNTFLVNSTNIMITDLIIDLKQAIKGKEIVPFTDDDLLMLDIPLLPDLDFDLSILGGNDNE